MSDPFVRDGVLLELTLALLDDYDATPMNHVFDCLRRALDDLDVDPTGRPEPYAVVARARALLVESGTPRGVSSES